MSGPFSVSLAAQNLRNQLTAAPGAIFIAPPPTKTTKIDKFRQNCQIPAGSQSIFQIKHPVLPVNTVDGGWRVNFGFVINLKLTILNTDPRTTQAFSQQRQLEANPKTDILIILAAKEGEVWASVHTDDHDCLFEAARKMPFLIKFCDQALGWYQRPNSV